MKNPKYFDLLINKMGWGLLALGSGPLILISLLAKLGIWPDANPNPIGLGIMALFTFWPSVTCIVIGTVFWLWKKYIERSDV